MNCIAMPGTTVYIGVLQKKLKKYTEWGFLYHTLESNKVINTLFYREIKQHEVKRYF